VTVDSADRKWEAEELATKYTRLLWRGRYNAVISK